MRVVLGRASDGGREMGPPAEPGVTVGVGGCGLGLTGALALLGRAWARWGGGGTPALVGRGCDGRSVFGGAGIGEAFASFEET
jgi:hypothetical protein